MRRCDYYNCIQHTDEESAGFVFCVDHKDYIDDLIIKDETGIEALRYCLSSLNNKADFGMVVVL